MSEAKRNILLTDDDKFLLEMYANKFAERGYNVEACLCVEDALKVLRGGYRPEVILFDLTMEGRDGLSLLKSLKDEHLAPNALYVAVSNHDDGREKAEAEKLGVQACIAKANTVPSEVVNTVSEALEKKSAHS